MARPRNAQKPKHFWQPSPIIDSEHPLANRVVAVSGWAACHARTRMIRTGPADRLVLPRRNHLRRRCAHNHSCLGALIR